jgi:hypothetical protein
MFIPDPGPWIPDPRSIKHNRGRGEKENQCSGYGSGSFYHHAKIIRKA